MIQQQNKQQDNNLHAEAKGALTASFAMPVIRTMADDLAEANNPIPVSVPVTSVPNIVTNTSVGSGKVPFDGSFNKIPAPPPPPLQPQPSSVSPSLKRPVVNNMAKVDNIEQKRNVVVVPDQLESDSKRSVGISILVGALVSLVLCAVVWAGWTYWPSKDATIADKIPAETLAFISFHKGSGAGEKVLPKIIQQFKISENSLGGQWSDLVYGILPGSTPSESIPYLLITGEGSVDLTGTEMGAKKMANGATVIVNNSVLGRLDGLTGKALGKKTEYNNLLSQLPKSTEYLYLEQSQLSSVIKTFTYISPNTDYPILLSLSSGGENLLAVSGAKGAGTEWISKQVAWDKLLKAVPMEILSSAGGTDLGKSFDDWRVAQANNPKMQEFLNGLNDQGKVLEKIRADLTGAYIAGNLSSTNLLPDGIAVVEIKDGSAEDLKAQMTQMEGALAKLGNMIGGAEYADTSFADANYKDVAIRFANFGDSSHSFDYAIIDSVLLVSSSKNSMQKMIDVYKGESESFASVANSKGQTQNNWQYILFSADTLAKLPSSLNTLLSGFKAIYIEPTGTKTFNGNIAF